MDHKPFKGAGTLPPDEKGGGSGRVIVQKALGDQTISNGRT